MNLAVIADPIHTLNVYHDSTIAMLWEADARGWPLYYFESKDLFLQNGKAYGVARLLKVSRDLKQWYSLQDKKLMPLEELDIILMRNDPPFNEGYLYVTQVLDYAEQAGVVVVNKPQALRDVNEKLAITSFPTCCASTLVASKIELLKKFWQDEKDIVCKPLHAMGGQSVFRIQPNDPNATVIFELLTLGETRHVMAQRFIPEIVTGDKRILLINGEPVPFALARIPQAGEWRGNMAVGAKPVAVPLSDRDRWICQQIAPFLRERGLYFVGIDVIGDYLTEINITSPTCVRELDEQCGLNISALLLDFLVGLVGD